MMPVANTRPLRDDPRMTRQARYQRRKRAGLRMLRPVLDPVEVASLLHSVGLIPTSTKPEALAAGLEALFEMWSTGDLHVNRARDSGW
jgi:hypothetical protein